MNIIITAIPPHSNQNTIFLAFDCKTTIAQLDSAAMFKYRIPLNRVSQ